jgi:hypothetical protein
MRCPGRRQFAPYDSVKIPVFIGAGAVSVNVLDVAVKSPNRARPVPEAAMAVVVPEVFSVPVPVAVGPAEYWVYLPGPAVFTQNSPVKLPLFDVAVRTWTERDPQGDVIVSISPPVSHVLADVPLRRSPE